MDNESLDQKRYENLKENSLSGKSGTRDGEKLKIKLSTYHRNLGIAATASALAVVLAINAGGAVINQVRDNMTLNSIVQQFKIQIISPETHRTQDNKNYYYDYSDIAEAIMHMDNPDIGFYLFYKNTGEYQTDKLMHETQYKTFEEYLLCHNYLDVEDFVRCMEQVTLLTKDMGDSKKEIDELMESHRVIIDDTPSSYGGK